MHGKCGPFRQLSAPWQAPGSLVCPRPVQLTGKGEREVGRRKRRPLSSRVLYLSQKVKAGIFPYRFISIQDEVQNCAVVTSTPTQQNIREPLPETDWLSEVEGVRLPLNLAVPRRASVRLGWDHQSHWNHSVQSAAAWNWASRPAAPPGPSVPPAAVAQWKAGSPRSLKGSTCLGPPAFSTA